MDQVFQPGRRIEDAETDAFLDTLRKDGETIREFIRRMICEPVLNDKGEVIDQRFMGMRPKPEKTAE